MCPPPERDRDTFVTLLLFQWLQSQSSFASHLSFSEADVCRSRDPLTRVSNGRFTAIYRVQSAGGPAAGDKSKRYTTQRKYTTGVAIATCNSCVDSDQCGPTQTPAVLSQMSWRRTSKCVCKRQGETGSRVYLIHLNEATLAVSLACMCK